MVVTRNVRRPNGGTAEENEVSLALTVVQQLKNLLKNTFEQRLVLPEPRSNLGRKKCCIYDRSQNMKGKLIVRGLFLQAL